MEKKVTETCLIPLKFIKLYFPLFITVDIENEVVMKMLRNKQIYRKLQLTYEDAKIKL